VSERNINGELAYIANNDIAEQPFDQLKDALKARNNVYVMHGPPSWLTLQPISAESNITKSVCCENGETIPTYHLHHYRISDRAYQLESSRHRERLAQILDKTQSAHNQAAKIYNKARLTLFLLQSQQEYETSKPCIQRGFDKELWRSCVNEVLNTTN
jgi:hypothetical protein